jgi:hypothetical protein
MGPRSWCVCGALWPMGWTAIAVLPSGRAGGVWSTRMIGHSEPDLSCGVATISYRSDTRFEAVSSGFLG